MLHWLIYLPLITQQTPAEYRVFNLQLQNEDGKVMREFSSTLDPLQYVGYHPVPKGMRVLYTHSWLCPGYTGHMKALCPDPNKSPAQSAPSESPRP